MKRITKYKDGKFMLNHSSMNEAIDKLGKLENYEDKIGLSLEEIIEIDSEMNRNLGSWVYEKQYDSTISKYSTLDLSINVNFSKQCFILRNAEKEIWKPLYFSEYKKFWSLDKEDLE